MNLHSPRILTSTRTQGRFGNGHGVEYTEEYFVEYWRPGFNKWVRWRNRRGMEVRIYIYIYRHIHTHIHTHTFCSMPIDSKPITYSTFSFFSFDLDLLTFRIFFFFFKNTVVFGNTNGIFSSRIWNRTFSFDLDLAQFLKIEFFFISISTLCFHSRLKARSILNYENYY